MDRNSTDSDFAMLESRLARMETFLGLLPVPKTLGPVTGTTAVDLPNVYNAVRSLLNYLNASTTI